MKDIVVVANFSKVFYHDDNERLTYICRELSKTHKVELVASDFCHGEKKHKKILDDKSYKVTCIHEPGYPKNICLKRFWSHFCWGKGVGNYLKRRKKPDVIYCAVPSLTAAFYASAYCKKNGIRFFVDIQDLWPEAFKMVFKVPIFSDLIFAPFNFIANKIYKNADEIVAVSETYANRALSVNKKVKKGTVVFIGTDLNSFDNNCKMYKSNAPDDKIHIAYCGTLGASYDLITIFDAMYILKMRGVDNLQFIVMGDGPLKNKFEQYAKDKNLDVVFTGKLPYSQMCARLSSCDIAVNCIKKGSAGSIINKHADYSAAGLPVVNTQESDEYRNLVSLYNIGVNCKVEDSEDVANALYDLIIDKNKMAKMGANSRLLAEEKFDRSVTYQSLITLVDF